MVVEASTPIARTGRIVRFVLLGLFTLYIGHDAVFLAQFGAGPALDRAMATSGHGPHWLGFGLLAVAAAALLAAWSVDALSTLVAAAARSRSRHRARRPSSTESGRRAGALRWDGYLREVVDLWPPLVLATLVSFAVLENIEHLASDGHLLGLGALTGPEYPLAIPVLVAVTGLVSAIGAVVRWRIAALRRETSWSPGRTRVVRARRAAPVAWQAIAAGCAHHLLLVRLDPGRAPPAFVEA